MGKPAVIQLVRLSTVRMNELSISKAAKALMDVRRGGAPIAALPAGCAPASLAEAYAIQDALIGRLSPVAGWKIAPMADDSGLWVAPLHRDGFLGEPKIDGRSLRTPMVEAEIAFRMLRDIPAGAGGQALCEAMELLPLFEILSPRFVDFMGAPFFSNLADFYHSHAISLGLPIADWAGVDRSTLHIAIMVDGVTIDSFDYGARLDFAIGLMERFATNWEGRTGVMRKGMVVTTGAMKFFPPGRHIVADYGPFGVNEITVEKLDEART